MQANGMYTRVFKEKWTLTFAASHGLSCASAWIKGQKNRAHLPQHYSAQIKKKVRQQVSMFQVTRSIRLSWDKGKVSQQD